MKQRDLQMREGSSSGLITTGGEGLRNKGGGHNMPQLLSHTLCSLAMQVQHTHAASGLSYRLASGGEGLRSKGGVEQPGRCCYKILAGWFMKGHKVRV
jgi:hypothetical protein